MSTFRVRVNSKNVTVKVLSRSGNSAALEIEGERYEVSLDSEGQKAPSLCAKSTTKAKLTSSGNEVYAPLPGLVASILVHEGERVSLGQPVLVIEAMKMENSISATRDGTVKKIHVAQGKEVQANQLLITIA